MSHPIVLLAALALLPSPAGAAPACREALGRDVAGSSLDERIQFYNSNADICPRSLNAEDCNDSRQAIVQALESLRAKIDKACTDAEQAEAQARNDCRGAESCLNALNGVNERARTSLGSVQQELDQITGNMKLIREFTVRSVRVYSDTNERDRTAYPQGMPRPKPFSVMADAVIKAAENLNTKPDDLRRQIMALNGKGHDKAVNTLWMAANALEVEQFSMRQKAQVRSSITGLNRNTQLASGRQGNLGQADRKSAITGPNQPPPAQQQQQQPGGNPLAQALGSPAFPALVGQASQLSAKTPSALPEVRKAADALSAPANLPEVRNLVAGASPRNAGAAASPGAGTAGDAKKTADPLLSRLDNGKASGSDFAFGTGGAGKGLVTSAGGGTGTSQTGSKSLHATGGGGFVGSESESGGRSGPAPAAARALASGAEGGDQPPGSSDGGGGGNSLTDISLYPEAPTEPTLDGAAGLGPVETAALLENPLVHGSAAAGELVSAAGPTLFKRVWIVHARSLKRGLVAGPRPKL